VNARAVTGQLLGQALAEMAKPQPPPKPARHWLSKCLTFEAACEVLTDYRATGEVTDDQDPDIRFENGLWVVSIAEGQP
jgi:hypothetical protein